MRPFGPSWSYSDLSALIMPHQPRANRTRQRSRAPRHPSRTDHKIIYLAQVVPFTGGCQDPEATTNTAKCVYHVQCYTWAPTYGTSSLDQLLISSPAVVLQCPRSMHRLTRASSRKHKHTAGDQRAIPYGIGSGVCAEGPMNGASATTMLIRGVRHALIAACASRTSLQ